MTSDNDNSLATMDVSHGQQRLSPLSLPPPSDLGMQLKFTDSAGRDRDMASNQQGRDRDRPLTFVTRTGNKASSDSTRGRGGGMTQGDTSPTTTTTTTTTTPQEEESLWEGVERVMEERRACVREVMEEFGVADAPAATDGLEEELWKVVEGRLTLTEAAELV